MKTFVVLLFLFGFFITSKTQNVSPSQVSLLMQLHNECKKETGISDAVATKAITGTFPDDPVFKQHTLCINKKMGIIDDDGHFDKEAMIAILETITKDAATAQQYVDDCAVEKATPEESTYEATKCLYTKTNNKA